MTTQQFQTDAKRLIDDLKAVCANAGLGNDGNEFKIITQIFLYKFLNDKFAYEAKRIEPKLAQAESWEDALRAYSADDYEMLLAQLGGSTAQLKPEHFLSSLYNRQNEDGFAKILDDTLIDIAALNADVFSVANDEGEKLVLFEAVTEYVSSKRNEFAKAMINKLIHFSFEQVFAEKFDFFATLFEYLIKDYNKDGGGKYAEYYTPACRSQDHGRLPRHQSARQRLLLRSLRRFRHLADESRSQNWRREVQPLLAGHFPEILQPAAA